MPSSKPSRPDAAGVVIVRFVVRWLILACAVWLAAAVLEGIHLDGWESTLVVAAILGLLNAVLRPFLFVVSLPITCLTLGVFVLVLNTGMLALTAFIAGKVDGVRFAIDGFWAAFFGALIISVVSWALGWLAPSPRKRSR